MCNEVGTKYSTAMSIPRLTVLVVGATGSIGRLVVDEAVRKGDAVRALARDPGKARRLFPHVETVAGDLTRPDTLSAAVIAWTRSYSRTARTTAARPERSESTTEACGTCS